MYIINAITITKYTIGEISLTTKENSLYHFLYKNVCWYLVVLFTFLGYSLKSLDDSFTVNSTANFNIFQK